MVVGSQEHCWVSGVFVVCPRRGHQRPRVSPPADLRQELAVRERNTDVTRMSAPSSPTLDIDKMDSAVQASLSLPATPVGKNIENAFTNSKGDSPFVYSSLSFSVMLPLLQSYPPSSSILMF